MSTSLTRLLELRAQGHTDYNKLVGRRELGPSTETEDEWARDTAAAIRPFSEVQAAKFENPAGGGGDQLNRYAARLYTLDRFLDEIQDGTVVHTPQSKPRGRKPGQGAMADGDAILEMHRLVTEEGLTVLKAAGCAANLAPGVATIEQKTKRIYDKYRGLWPN